MFSVFTYLDILKQVHVISVSLFIAILFVRAVVMGARSETVIEKFNRRVRIPNALLGPIMLISGIVLLYMNYKATHKVENYMLGKLGLVGVSLITAAIGRRRKNLSLVGLSLVLFSLAMAVAFFRPGVEDVNLTADETLIVPDTTAKEQQTSATEFTEEQRILLEGKKVFLERGCGSCHGITGSSGFQSNKNLESSVLSDDQIIQVVTEGRGPMPPLRKKIPDEEMTSLIAFVKSLRVEKKVVTTPNDLSQ